MPSDEATPPVTKICLVCSVIRCATDFEVIRLRRRGAAPRAATRDNPEWMGPGLGRKGDLAIYLADLP